MRCRQGASSLRLRSDLCRGGIVQGQTIEFPLLTRAESCGVLDGNSALIVAPTATGKSHIGRETIRRAVGTRNGTRTHAYLVPFRALADEVYDSFLTMLSGTDARVRISSGDHRDPIRPGDADLIVATYESFVGLVRSETFRPGVVVADEVHLIADASRGAVVEGLFARLLASGKAESICALSAVVENADELANWLDVQLVEGTAADRPVPLRLESQLVSELHQGLLEAIGHRDGSSQALVFCNSRAGAEGTARKLAEQVGSSLSEEQLSQLRDLSEAIRNEDPDAEDVAQLMRSGVAYHHAGLPKPLRRRVEESFRGGVVQVVTATPTLAAGVNLPAELVVVRDVFRTEVVRGVHRRVLVPSGEILNMLGRAGRPFQASDGQGIALIDKRFGREATVKDLIASIRKGRGSAVRSRLQESFESLMRFVLSVVVERGETTLTDISNAFERTLAFYMSGEPVSFDRTFEDDLMEDIPAYKRVLDANGSIRLERYDLSTDGVHAYVASGNHGYEVTLGVSGTTCECPAASQFYRGKICKHQACAIHELLFAAGIDDEARARAIYSCGHVFSNTLTVGTRITQALVLLGRWKMIERVASGWRATPMGVVAVVTGFDLLLVHQVAERIASVEAATFQEIALWAVQDYFAEEKDRDRWSPALAAWLDEKDVHEIKLPTKYRGDFERGLEDLARVCVLYEQSAAAQAKPAVAKEARAAGGSIRYGVAPELVPLMALQLPQLGRARSRYLYERGIASVADLASAVPGELAHPRRAPEAYVRSWVERAMEIRDAGAGARSEGADSDQELDELVAKFRLDPAALG